MPTYVYILSEYAEDGATWGEAMSCAAVGVVVGMATGAVAWAGLSALL